MERDVQPLVLSSCQYDQTLHERGCIVHNCQICSTAIGYICYDYVNALEKQMKCDKCRCALFDSQQDPCEDSSVRCQTYKHQQGGSITKHPNGSIYRLLLHCEKIFRQNKSSLPTKNFEKRLLIQILMNLDQRLTFPTLSQHQFDTADGMENHCTTLVHLISRKYIHFRTTKFLKDSTDPMNIGNFMHRMKIFQNV